MPIRPPPPTALSGDLERARQIARSWKPLDQLSPADAEIVAKAIAEGIATSRPKPLGLRLISPDAASSRQRSDRVNCDFRFWHETDMPGWPDDVCC